jgi:hypothetical protein
MQIKFKKPSFMSTRTYKVRGRFFFFFIAVVTRLNIHVPRVESLLILSTLSSS